MTHPQKHLPFSSERTSREKPPPLEAGMKKAPRAKTHETLEIEMIRIT